MQWKDNGKFDKENWCKTCNLWERLFKMDIKTKLYVAKNMWQYFGAISKRKNALMVNNLANFGVWVLDLSKVLMSE